jgi:hypothetical protein
MNYGLRNKQTGQVEQIVEGTKAEAQKLCRILNKDPRTRAGHEAPPEPPLHEGERVTFEVVPLEEDSAPAEE